MNSSIQLFVSVCVCVLGALCVYAIPYLETSEHVKQINKGANFVRAHNDICVYRLPQDNRTNISRFSY